MSLLHLSFRNVKRRHNTCTTCVLQIALNFSVQVPFTRHILCEPAGEFHSVGTGIYNSITYF